MIASCQNSNQRSATLALGGGGARGLAHFGAVQAVREAGFAVERIVGVSIGSLAGAMCALDHPISRVHSQVLEYVTSSEFSSKQEALFGAHPKAEMGSTSGMMAWYERIRMYLWARHLLSRVFHRSSLLPGEILEEVITGLVPDIDICETSTPLSIVAVDLKSGHQIVLEQGSLRRAIAASAAIPGIFPPVPWDDMLLCDVGVLDSLPAQVARAYASDLVIGVDVGPRLEHAEDCESALHVLLRMDEIGERYFRRYSQKLVDILIQPDVGHYQWFDFSEPDRLIRTGLAGGRAAISGWMKFRPRERADEDVSSVVKFYSAWDAPTRAAQ